MNSTSGRKIPQYIVGVGVMMILVQVGISAGWMSPYLAKLIAPDSPLPLSLHQVSWVASLMMAGRFTGAALGAISANYQGSKKTMVLILISLMICWILTYLAQTAIWLYIARFCAGLALGIMYSSFPLYIGEVALPEIRGILVTLAGCGGTFGLVLGTVFGSFLSLRASAAIYLVPCLALVVLFVWLPESPHHLVKVGQQEKAKKSIRWYRSNYKVEEEFQFVTNFVSVATSQSTMEKLRDFSKPAIKKATMLAIIAYIFMQMCGYNIILVYLEIVLKTGKFTLVEPKIAAMYVNFMALIATIPPVFLIERCGRRLLLIISGVGTAVALAGIGVHFVLINEDSDKSDTQWLLVTSLVLFQIFAFLGVMCVPNVLLGELFPANVKYLAACSASIIGAMFAFLDLKTYQPLVDLMGQSNVFFLHAFLTILVVPYTLIFLPETKGKTLQQIQDDLE